MKASGLIMQRWRDCILAITFAFAGSMAAAAGLTEHAELDRLLREGERQQALDWIDRRLSAQANQATLLLMKGVLLVESERIEEAKKVFQDLIRIAPQLPQAYNNLAVLYARQGDLAKARTTLERAIKANPAYTVAHENLADIYARLAGEAYARSLDAYPGDRVAQQSGPSDRTESRQPRSQADHAGSAQIASISTAPKGVSTPEPPEPTAMRGSATVASNPVAASVSRDEVLAAVERWRQAWSARDMVSYFAAYVPGYAPAGQAGGHAAWVKQRTARIQGKSQIEVKLENITVLSLEDQEARVRFHQRYQAPGLKSSSHKELELRRSNGQWQISAERLVR